MRVIALRSFVAIVNGTKYRVSEGDELEMPVNADWLTAGLVVALPDAPQEAAVMPVQETAVMPRVVKRGRRTTK